MWSFDNSLGEIIETNDLISKEITKNFYSSFEETFNTYIVLLSKYLVPRSLQHNFTTMNMSPVLSNMHRVHITPTQVA